MSNTTPRQFLPFVTSDSPPLKIWSMLLSRSKGINEFVLMKTFYIILEKGIEEVRPHMMGDIPMKQQYENLVNYYNGTASKIEDKDYFTFLDIYKRYSDQLLIKADFKQFVESEEAQFLFVMGLIEDLSEYVENYNLVYNFFDYKDYLADLPKYIRLDNDGEPVSVASETELRNYIIYHCALNKANGPAAPVRLSIEGYTKQRGDEDEHIPF